MHKEILKKFASYKEKLRGLASKIEMLKYELDQTRDDYIVRILAISNNMTEKKVNEAMKINRIDDRLNIIFLNLAQLGDRQCLEEIEKNNPKPKKFKSKKRA